LPIVIQRPSSVVAMSDPRPPTPDRDPKLSAVDLNQSTSWGIWKISAPVMLSSVLFTFQTTVNMFWVGKLGGISLAAVALAGSILGVFQTLAGMVSAGTLATCARFSGANDRTGIQESLFHSLFLGLAIAAALALPGALLSHALLRVFGAEPAVVAAGKPFLMVLMAFLPAYFASTVFSAGFQALGDTRTPMWVSLAVNVVNLILDPLLILGWLHFPRLGVPGAAIATATSQVLGAAALGLILGRRGLLRFDFRFRLGAFRRLLAIGVPASLQAITRPLTGMLMFRIVASFGSPAIAAFGVGLRILNIMYIYLNGFGVACQSLVGQNLGARQPDVARRVAARVQVIATALQLAVLSVLFGFAPQIIRIFNADPEIVRFGTSYLRVLAPFLVLLGISTAWSGSQYGAGATRPTMIAAILANWLVKLPLAYILSRVTSLSLTGVWLGIGISVVVETVVLGIFYFRGNWWHKEIEWQG
jgi:putative MATE family efflux protein